MFSLRSLGIGYMSAAEPRPGRKRMEFRAIDSGYFARRNAACQQRIGDQGPVTSPWNSLGAHNRGLLPLRQFYQIHQTFLELGCLHVVCIAPETGIAPPGIDGIRAWMTESTQSRHVLVMQARGMQCRRECGAVELRIVP